MVLYPMEYNVSTLMLDGQVRVINKYVELMEQLSQPIGPQGKVSAALFSHLLNTICAGRRSRAINAKNITIKAEPSPPESGRKARKRAPEIKKSNPKHKSQPSAPRNWRSESVRGSRRRWEMGDRRSEIGDWRLGIGDGR